MVSISRRLLIPALLLGWLGLTMPACAAVAPVIKDDGKFFSAEAVDKANAQIKKIAQDYDKDLLIETFAGITADLKKDYEPEKKKEFFEKWARSRAHENAVNGVYVLICKDPPHLQVEVGNETQKKAFTMRNRNELAKILLEKFRAKKYDEGLQEAVDYFGKTLRQNLGRSSGGRFQSSEEWPGLGVKNARRLPAPAGEGGRGGNPIMGYLCIGIVVLLGLWVLFGLLRAFTGGGRGGYGGYGGGGYGGGGGGGFFSSLLGGMFGAAAGMWMYDHFFGGSSGWGGAAHAGTSTGGMDVGGADDTDYSGTGGDFGDDGGGGDFGGDDGGGGGDFGGDDGGGGDFDGGGDFGGGDFGGGDFGGGDFGGGDFGGGGDF